MKKKLLIVSSVFILLDQLIKIIVRNSIIVDKEISIIPKFFYLTNVSNTGGAFSILSNNTYFLILIGIIAVGIIYYFLRDKKISLIEEIAYGLLIGGIIGNLIDRLFRNYVVDFLSFNIFGYNFPIFNIADCYIVISIGLIILKMIMDDRKKVK